MYIIYMTSEGFSNKKKIFIYFFLATTALKYYQYDNNTYNTWRVDY